MAQIDLAVAYQSFSKFVHYGRYASAGRRSVEKWIACAAFWLEGLGLTSDGYRSERKEEIVCVWCVQRVHKAWHFYDACRNDKESDCVCACFHFLLGFIGSDVFLTDVEER